jgi:hypothetical protein
MHNPISLQTLATEIIVEHAAARRGGADDSKHALAAGQGLIAAKALVRPGEWASWLKVNLPNLSIPTCQRYMRMAKQADSASSDFAMKDVAAERGGERFTPNRDRDAARREVRGSIEPAVPPWPRVGYEEDQQLQLRFINWHLGGDPNEVPITGQRPLRRAATWEDIQLSGLASKITRPYYLCGIHGDLSEDEACALHALRVHRDFSKAHTLAQNGAASPLFSSEVEKLCRRRGRGRPKGRKIITYAMLAASDVDRILALWRKHYPKECQRTKDLPDEACSYAGLRWQIHGNSVKYCRARARWRELP